MLLLASAAFVTNDLFSFRRNMVADLFIFADLVGINSTAGLIFKDNFTTEENIAALKAHSHITLTYIFSKDGKLFASYCKENIKKPKYSTLGEYYFQYVNQENNQIKDNYFFSKNHVDIFKQIIFKDKVIGTVYIQSDLDAFNERLFLAVSIMGIVMLFSLILACWLASRFQAIITAPIYRLLETMKLVSTNQNYSLRGEKISDDELGKLIDGFNEMLEQIEKRDTELAEARDQAMTANKAKSAFLANMSHELRTPLNGILGYAQILNRDNNLNPNHKKGIDIIQSSGEYLLTLINDILDLSKIEAGKLELSPNEFHLVNFINGIAELFKMRAEQQEITFSYEFSKRLPVGVYGDEIRLRQILINLLGNAVKFTQAGTVSLKVDYYNGKVHFKVADTGMGIATDKLDTIFLPFQQAGEQNYRAQGTGLGLSITKKLISMMGGKLQVESVLGEGSVFWMALDLPVTSHQLEADSVKKPIIIGYHNLPNLPLKILVIDDNYENRNIIKQLLKPFGFNVIEAVNGEDGLDKAIKFCPDLIVMDLIMPKMDGFESTREIRKIPEFKKLPIIASSASVFKHHREDSLKAGCNAFLAKPIYDKELFELISQYLHLEAIYEETSVSTENPEEIKISELQKLPAEQATILFNLAMIGDIAGILEFADNLKQSDTQFLAVATRICELANQFDNEKLCELAENSMENVT